MERADVCPRVPPSDLGAPSGLCGLLFARNVPLTFHRRPEGACMGLGSGFVGRR